MINSVKDQVSKGKSAVLLEGEKPIVLEICVKSKQAIQKQQSYEIQSKRKWRNSHENRYH